MKPIILAGCTDQFARKAYEALDETDRSRLRLWTKHLAEPGGLELLRNTGPAVAVIGPGLIDDVALRFANEIATEWPGTGVVLVRNSSEPLNDAQAGPLNAVLSMESDNDAIRSAFATAVAAADAADAPTQQTATAAPAGRGRVITVLSPKGGAGKTVLSTNLAVGLAARSPRGVVIVDLDLQFGDVAYALGLRPRHTMHDAVAAPGRLDATTLKVFLTHHESDLYAMCAPDDPARGELISVEVVHEIIGLLAAEFDHVVIDTAAGLTEHSLVALDASTDVVFLADMDVLSLRHLNKVIEAFDRLGMNDANRHYVLNRADARVGLSMAKAANQAGLSIDIEIPVSKQVPVSINTGVPIFQSNPRNPVARKIEELIDRLNSSVREIRPTLKWSA